MLRVQDTFDPKDFGEQPSQRVATVLVYLSGALRAPRALGSPYACAWGHSHALPCTRRPVAPPCKVRLALPVTDVEEGGETVFLREGRANANLAVNDYKSCASGAHCAGLCWSGRISTRRVPWLHQPLAPAQQQALACALPSTSPHPPTPSPPQCSGFKYRPRRGDAVLFHSLTPDGQIDPRSLHGGCPVLKGVKWVGE